MSMKEDILKFFDPDVVKILSYLADKRRIRSYREILKELGVSYYKLYKVMGILVKLNLIEEYIRTEELPARVEVKITDKGIDIYNHLKKVIELLTES